MANRVMTVFQHLDKAISGNWDMVKQPTSHVNSYNMSDTDTTKILYKADNKEDYEKAKLELQQNAYLNQRWQKANIDLSVQAFNGLNNVKLMYRDAELMDSFPEIGAALDILAEEACLEKNTKIKLLNGEIHTIKDLFDSNYTNFWCYAVDENGTTFPTLIEKVIYKGKKELYKIVLDDETELLCTDNHQWMLSDCTWKETKDLCKGDSLMSLYDNLNYKGYEQIKSTTEKKKRLTHQIVAENILHSQKIELSKKNTPYQKIVIHHKSFNKLNNDPNQLVYMFWNDHQKLHTNLNSERWKNEEFASKMKKIFSSVNSKLWKESKREDLREKFSIGQKRRIENMTDEERRSFFGRKGSKNGMYDVHRYGSLNPNYDTTKNHYEDIDKKEYINFLKNIKSDNCVNELAFHFNLPNKVVTKINRELCQEYNVCRINGLRSLLQKNNNEELSFLKIKEIIQNDKKVTTSSLGRFFNVDHKKIESLIKENGYNTLHELKESAYNHRVKSVEKLNYCDDVYDLYNSSVNNCFGIKCNEGQIISHNCYLGNHGSIINVYSSSDRIKNVLEDLFMNRLDITVTAPMIIRAMCKYGNQFMMLNIDNKIGITGWRQLPVFNVERLENGIVNPYSTTAIGLNAATDTDMTTKFVWTDETNTQIPFRNWQIGHFRLLTNSLYLPYGVSYLNNARRHWRMLSLMEDMMLIYRLERSVERRVYKIYVGAIDDADVKAYVEDIANNFKRTPIIDPMTGQVDLRKNILDVSQDIFIPVRDQNAPTPIDTLSAGQNLTAMDDIKFVQNKVFTALRIPKTFLNFEQEAGDGKNLSLMDVRFMRTVNRVQQAFLMELTKIASIHLYLLGFEDELTNFSLSMNNPSSQAESLEIENTQKKISAIRDAVADPGNGIPIMSLSRALKEIMKWSDKDIQDNLEEIRLEKGIAAELEKTGQIIKKTGIFDTVDRIYGEPGAEYQDGQDQGQGDDGGMGGGMPGGGGGDFGGGLDDLGAPGGEEEGDLGGEEGEMPLDDGGGAPPPEEGGGEQPMESKKNRKPLLTEAKMSMKKNPNTQMFFNEYLKRLGKPKDEYMIERADIYDNALLINEEFDKMINSLGDFFEDKKSEQ